MKYKIYRQGMTVFDLSKKSCLVKREYSAHEYELSNHLACNYNSIFYQNTYAV